MRWGDLVPVFIPAADSTGATLAKVSQKVVMGSNLYSMCTCHIMISLIFFKSLNVLFTEHFVHLQWGEQESKTKKTKTLIVLTLYLTVR